MNVGLLQQVIEHPQQRRIIGSGLNQFRQAGDRVVPEPALCVLIDRVQLAGQERGSPKAQPSPNGIHSIMPPLTTSREGLSGSSTSVTTHRYCSCSFSMMPWSLRCTHCKPGRAGDGNVASRIGLTAWESRIVRVKACVAGCERNQRSEGSLFKVSPTWSGTRAITAGSAGSPPRTDPPILARGTLSFLGLYAGRGRSGAAADSRSGAAASSACVGAVSNPDRPATTVTTTSAALRRREGKPSFNLLPSTLTQVPVGDVRQAGLL